MESPRVLRVCYRAWVPLWLGLGAGADFTVEFEAGVGIEAVFAYDATSAEEFMAFLESIERVFLMNPLIVLLNRYCC